MPDPKKYNLEFRPRSYWGPQEVDTHVGARVKGELRRKQALKDLEEGHADPEIISESLTEEHRTAAGAVHPWLMGGEYLPDLLPNEVEICRIVLKSTTMDVFSIRARKQKHRIVYNINDEYGETDYILPQKTSLKPLSMRQLVIIIDNSKFKSIEMIEPSDAEDIRGGLVLEGIITHVEAGYTPEEMQDFTTAHSVFYPEIEDYYEDYKEEWCAAKKID